MIEFREAVSCVLAQVRALPAVDLDLASSLHRTLADPVCSDIDQPPFDRSLMDGYAVRAVDVDTPGAVLRIAGQIAAGQPTLPPLGPREALQINTGAPIPHSADSVVRLEDVEVVNGGASIVVSIPVSSGQYITRKGAYKSAGDTVLRRGDLLTPVNMGVAAAAGAAKVRVFAKPRAAVIVTGNELVEVSRRPVGSQIRNSNLVQLAALLHVAHTESTSATTVPDEPDQIREAITAASSNDVICLTGGVSMGAFDFVPQVLDHLGAARHFHKVAIKPGRPTLFATLPSGSLVFALPGNPISCFVGFQLFLLPALAALQGRQMPLQLRRGVLRGAFASEGRRTAFYPASLGQTANGEQEVTRLSWGGSGDALGMAGAQALIVRQPGSAPVGDGEVVEFLPL